MTTLRRSSVFVLIAVLLAACAPAGTIPESGSGYNYRSDARIGVDPNIYTITGEVIGDVNSLVRQTDPAYGSAYVGPYGGGGSYYGPEFGGKGFVRLLVYDSDSALAQINHIVILKSDDTKGSVLLPGDVVTFKCRAQFEAIAAMYEGEPFDQNDSETWELDYCRLVTPDLGLRPD